MITAVDRTTYRSTSLPMAPTRSTVVDAEADEVIAVELVALFAAFQKLTGKQWIAAAEAAHSSPHPRTAIASMKAADANRLTLAWSHASSTAWRTARDAWTAAAGADAVADLWRIEAPLLDAAYRAANAVVSRQFITRRQFQALTKPLRAVGINFDTLS